MKHRNLKCFLAIIYVLSITGVFAQQTVVSAGGQNYGSGGTISYSVGLLVAQSSTGATGTLTPGPHQIYIDKNLVGINQPTNDLQLKVYPNPVADQLLLKVDHANKMNYAYFLYDLNGKVLQHEQIVNDETYIQMSTQAIGSYLLKIVQQTEQTTEIQSFKIIKK